MVMKTNQQGSEGEMCDSKKPGELTQRVKSLLAAAPMSTQHIICRHAYLNVEKVCVMFGVATAGALAEPDDATPSAADYFLLWPMVVDEMLASPPLDCVSGGTPELKNLSVDQGIVSFIIDTLTSLHLTLVTENSQHVSVSLNIDFLQPLIAGYPFTLSTRLFWVGRRICFLGAEIHQEHDSKSVLCVRADHTKTFYKTKPQRRSEEIVMSRL